MPAVEVLPGIYIRSGLLDDRDIPSHWARLTIREGPAPRHPADRLHVDIPDDLPWAPETIGRIVDFIRSRAEAGTPVLVECMAGVSRSPSAVVAYLTRTRRLPVTDALALLRSAYPPADPSARILDSLDAYFSDARPPGGSGPAPANPSAGSPVRRQPRETV